MFVRERMLRYGEKNRVIFERLQENFNLKQFDLPENYN